MAIDPSGLAAERSASIVMHNAPSAILLTGSNGYIGYAVAQRLAESFNVVGA